MSRLSKISWLLCILSFVILGSTRFILGGWINYLFIPLAIFVVTFFVALIADYRLYIDFLTMRTTKHGMNMGVMILLAIAFLTMVNFLSVEFDKTWDLTAEKLHSLSPQSTDVLNGLTQDVTFKAFYGGQKDQNQKQNIKEILNKYEIASNKVKVRFVNAYVDQAQAAQYLKGTTDIGQGAVFVEYGDKRIKVETPISEENITSAIVKATRRDSKKVYFLSGHGERKLEGEEEGSISSFKQALEDASFKVESLSLLETKSVPEDANIIAIVGPQTPLLAGEIEELKKFAAKGGRLFIAADPGQRHNVAEVTKWLGVEFGNNYILNPGGQVVGLGPAAVFGFPQSGHEVVKKFDPRSPTLFNLASELTKLEETPGSLTQTPLVKTSGDSVVVNKLEARINVDGMTMEPRTIAMAVEGRLPGETIEKDGKKEAKESAEFAAIIVGDSDFVTQRDIIHFVNVDFAINSVAFLAKETDLISIRPKQPEGTKLTMTTTTQNIVVIAGVALPLVFLSLSGVFWYRRRSA